MTVQQLIDRLTARIAEGKLDPDEHVIIHSNGVNQGVRRMTLVRGDGLLLETH